MVSRQASTIRELQHKTPFSLTTSQFLYERSVLDPPLFDADPDLALLDDAEPDPGNKMDICSEFIYKKSLFTD